MSPILCSLIELQTSPLTVQSKTPSMDSHVHISCHRCPTEATCVAVTCLCRSFNLRRQPWVMIRLHSVPRSVHLMALTLFTFPNISYFYPYWLAEPLILNYHSNCLIQHPAAAEGQAQLWNVVCGGEETEFLLLKAKFVTSCGRSRKTTL